MLDLGTSFLASVARDPEALAIVDGDMRLTYGDWYRAHLGAGRAASTSSGSRRRSSRHGAAEPLGGRDHPLGLPVRRHHHHAAELALHRRRARFLPRRCRGQGDRLRARRRPKRCDRSTRSAKPRSHRRRAARRARPRFERARRAHSSRRCAAAGRCRGLVGHALYVRHHGAAQGRAAPPARRARRGARACGAESLPPRRAHARRDAALSHHGCALAARDVADRRRLRLPAAFRCCARARADRGREDHQSLSGADALPRPRPSRALRRRPT